MRELVVNSWCDACVAADVREPGHTVTVTIHTEGTRPVGPLQLELCEHHGKDLVAPVLEALEAWGHKPGGDPKLAPGAAKASQAVKAASSAAAASGAGGPAPGPPVSGAALQRLVERLQTPDGRMVCPVCATEASTTAALTQHFRSAHQTGGKVIYGGTCPICGHASGSIGMHAARTHDLATNGAHETFLQAAQAGDVFGVVRAMLARASE